MKIGVDLNGMEYYSVPLTNLNGRLKMANRFVFGNVSAAGTRNQIGVKKNRTILLVGSSESDKTSLINAMANFALNVDGQDPFRFHLVPEEADDSKINVYDLRHVDGFRIQHLLTVIDTPSYDESDPEKNEKITDMVDAYFKDENAIQEIDVVGFVMNSPIGSLSPLEVHIYCSLISIFGNKIKEDVNFLFTYADEEELAVFEAHDEAVLVTTPFHHYKFNNSAVFRPRNQQLDYLAYWDNFQKFFSSLALATTNCMSVAHENLCTKTRQEEMMEGLMERMMAGSVEFRILREMKAKFDCENEDLEIQSETLAVKNVLLHFGKRAMNCQTCQMTCHLECATSDGTFNCDVMDHSLPEERRTCLVCPGNCPWNVHRKDSYRLKKDGQTTTCRAIKEKYEAKLKRKLTLPKLVQVLQTDIEKKKKELVELVATLLRFVKRLHKFLDGTSELQENIKENVLSVLGQLIDDENKDIRYGFSKRKKVLGLFRQIAGGWKTPKELLILENDVVDLTSFNLFTEEDQDDEEVSCVHFPTPVKMIAS